MSRMKRTVLWLIAALFLIGGTACGSKDIDKRYFVISMGFDEGEKGKTAVTVKLAVPKGRLRHGSSEFVMMTKEDETIEGALNQIRTLTDKELDFGHMKLAVFSEGLAKKGLNTYVDWMQRSMEVQEICWVALGRPSAQEVLAYKPKSERYPSNNLFLTFDRTGGETDVAVMQYLFSFYRQLTEEGIDPVLPVITLEKQGLGIDHAAAFKKDKQVMLLNEDETRLYNMIKDHIRRVEWSLSFGPEEKIRHAVVSVRRHPSSYKIREGDKAQIQLQLGIKGVIMEIQPHTKVTPDIRSMVEEKLKGKLETELKDLMMKFQKAGIDPIGYGIRYRSRHWGGADEMKAWEGLYPKAVFQIQAKVSLPDNGAMK